LLAALIDYGLFLAKTLTVFIAIGVLALLLLRARRAHEEDDPGQLELVDLNARYRDLALEIKKATLPRKTFTLALKAERKQRQARAKANDKRRRVFVIDFRGDLMASEVGALRESITALLLELTPADEVLVRLENAGGAVHEHGLGASQLLRLRARGIPLTVAVDKIAASGGYLMAAVADRILAAPFAVIGSIGVVAELPNFHRWLERQGIDFELHTAGEHKRTLTLFGENTEAARAKLREQLAAVHDQFKELVKTHRAALDLDRVSTGEYWHGEQALALGLVDELRTSDDYLLAARAEADLFKVRWRMRKKPLARLLEAVRLTGARWWRRQIQGVA